MKIGFIGAGRAGCGIGKYFCTKKDQVNVQVTGYYSLLAQDAKWAADFTDSVFYERIEDVIAASDSIILSTPDGAIKDVWDSIPKDIISGRIICHLSGSLSSDVFSGIEDYGAYGISIHPLVAFSNKESVYEQLNEVSFTLEGHGYAVSKWQELFKLMGNATRQITKEAKPVYHAAASVLSNHVVAILDVGYELLKQCGFSDEEARSFSRILVKNNISNVIQNGTVDALTGPIERGDAETVKKHLSVLDKHEKNLYKACGKKLVSISKVKNPEKDYSKIENIID
ncbi:MAG: Rossmann-like and DUF2520 domain-containing protein [Lachnospiraceae bacterium]